MFCYFKRSLLLSKRPLDSDSEKGFHKWPFMTTHAWSERSRGIWKIEIFFDHSDPQQPTTGEFIDWILVLHGTKEAPYTKQTPHSEFTKLAVARNIQQANFDDKQKFVDMLKLDQQKRVGDDLSGMWNDQINQLNNILYRHPKYLLEFD